MRTALGLTSCGLALLLGYSAHAQQVEAGTNLVCDTTAQIERVIALYDGDMQSAVERVNAEEHDAAACAVFEVAFIRGPELRTARKGNVLFQIVPILIVGVLTPDGIRSVSPAMYFSIIEIDERTA